MKRSMLLSCFFLLCILTISGATSPVIAPVPVPALSPLCTPAMQSSIAACPLTGCGEFGDALLNQMKNRFGPVSNPATATLDNIRGLSEPGFSTGDPRTGLATIENRVVVVQAFLLKAKREGAESCNCGITGPTNTDIHLVLVSQLPNMDDQDEVDQAEQESVTAEITPRVRKHGHPNWVVSKINDFEGEFVRLTGRMMLDTKHIPQQHPLQGERRNKRLKRATNWEVHPVTKFEVCNASISQCRQGNGWVNIP
jgi:hypothetical protein